ncbi:MAG: cyclopropane-fatty-acyl-phospholipid synthase [Proteobacteria bacterium]|nr:cyclopropane-fatty-acyl-phospholipid synthase [Pseudomonadota bacterium]MDA1058219.1 cyclopropane-fatty-acyl-phospholipid synthase [Pseudomonadota bacterium]
MTFANGRQKTFGGSEPGPDIAIKIADRATERRLFLNPELAAGEAFMDGRVTVENGDIYDFLELCLMNLGWGAREHWIQRLQGRLRRWGRGVAQYNPVGKAQRNVAHHYDLSDTLYDLFLDNDRQYSCAYYATGNETLEQAQEYKKRHIAAKLLLKPAHKVLDIGSGWGGLGLYISKISGADVTGVTLSVEQHKVSQQRAADRGVADQVRFKLQDYRLEDRRYDRIVSVGMFEHVGVGHYEEFFRKIKDLLVEDGVALLHTIGRADGPGATNPWLAKYIFPGGYTPALSEIVPVIERVGLHITDIEVLRLHYASTLRDWRRRFNMNRDKVRAIYDERFCRMWDFYLAGCEAAFRYGGQLNFQIQLSRRSDAVPLTRDYIQEFEAQHTAVSN